MEVKLIWEDSKEAWEDNREAWGSPQEAWAVDFNRVGLASLVGDLTSRPTRWQTGCNRWLWRRMEVEVVVVGALSSRGVVMGKDMGKCMDKCMGKDMGKDMGRDMGKGMGRGMGKDMGKGRDTTKRRSTGVLLGA